LNIINKYKATEAYKRLLKR